jgi:hypothetical protein
MKENDNYSENDDVVFTLTIPLPASAVDLVST